MATNNLGLSIGDLVQVDIALQPNAAALRSFGNLLIAGDSDIIDTNERIRSYTSVAGMAADGFSGTSPEYLAAQVFFSQTPSPPVLYVGRWASVATQGRVLGNILTAGQQTLSNFTNVTNGSLSLFVDGVSKALTGINLSTSVSLFAVAASITTAFAGSATCTWDPNNGRFIIRSSSTGTTSTVSAASLTVPGTNLGTLMGFDAGSLDYLSPGVSAETPAAAAAALANASNLWYGLIFAAGAIPSDDQYVAAAQFIEATTLTHIFGITTQNNAVLSIGSSDLASRLQALNLKRTFVQYSSTTPYAVAGTFGIAFTTDFTGTDTTITLKFKQPNGVAAETLTETQAANAGAKNCNFLVNYNNNTAILQEGVMASGAYFDVVQGSDWLQNYVQTAIFNLYATTPKVPQTDSGLNQVQAAAASALAQAVTNGLLAAGQWNGPAIGPLKNGAMLTQGFFLYSPQIATQSTADRAARKAPVIQAACKFAGAFHSAHVILSFNA